jgi:FtsZ-binding cell division protein ZapB
MSEPARSTAPHEPDHSHAPGPLRDWLSAMKAHTPAGQAAARPGSPDASRDPGAGRQAEPAWSPRIVPPAEAAGPDADADVSELMAENLMLKAKLRLEAERQDELQAMLADEIRSLREHVRDEMGAIEELRAELEELRTERDRFGLERETLRSERDALREERDLWRARTEALAQPLFQMQAR